MMQNNPEEDDTNNLKTVMKAHKRIVKDKIYESTISTLKTIKEEKERVSTIGLVPTKKLRSNKSDLKYVKEKSKEEVESNKKSHLSLLKKDYSKLFN